MIESGLEFLGLTAGSISIQGRYMSRDRPTSRRPDARSRKLSKPRSTRKGEESASLLEAAQLSVGQFLRSARESLHMTQAEVADKTRESPWQLSRAAVSAIERGQNFPGLEAMLALSAVLHIDPKELIERARMTAVVPVDVTGIDDAELESQASQYFWAGDFRQALAVYDAMVHKLVLEAPERDEAVSRLAVLEVRRATTLKRIGALISAVASIERAISLSVRDPKVQSEAYVVLSDLQAERGLLPLASDAAERAIRLATEANPTRLAWAHMVQGKARYLAGDHATAKSSFLEARKHAEAHHDHRHLSHIVGDIGCCCLALGEIEQAQRWIEQAVSLARENRQPALEASWLVELGKIMLRRGEVEEAARLASSALRLAHDQENTLTIFRAEWLCHRLHLAQRTDQDAPDLVRMARLKELAKALGEHEGVEEIIEYREEMLRGSVEGGGAS